jgi:hypothetical protein
MKELLWRAYLAGFKRSYEGWNGEFPWYQGDEKQEELKETLRHGWNGTADDSFEGWYEANVVDFECIDCGEHVTRPRNDNIDIDGMTPKRCGACTLDRMGER